MSNSKRLTGLTDGDTGADVVPLRVTETHGPLTRSRTETKVAADPNIRYAAVSSRPCR